MPPARSAVRSVRASFLRLSWLRSAGSIGAHADTPPMRVPLSLRRWTEAIVNPAADPAVAEALEAQALAVPVLWLLGKTGAGKSSIVQRLTGDSSAEIGNGYAPCTRHSVQYDHPAASPVMRFIDTRGLGEPGYDPHEELAASQCWQSRSAGGHAARRTRPVGGTRCPDDDSRRAGRAAHAAGAYRLAGGAGCRRASSG